MGGTVKLESTHGAGTTATLTLKLPLAPKRPACSPSEGLQSYPMQYATNDERNHEIIGPEDDPETSDLSPNRCETPLSPTLLHTTHVLIVEDK